MVSKKIVELISSSLLTCKLKFPSNTFSGHLGTSSVMKFVNSSKKALFVDLFLSEYGGWYIPMICIFLFLTSNSHVACSKDGYVPVSTTFAL